MRERNQMCDFAAEPNRWTCGRERKKRTKEHTRKRGERVTERASEGGQIERGRERKKKGRKTESGKEQQATTRDTK